MALLVSEQSGQVQLSTYNNQRTVRPNGVFHQWRKNPSRENLHVRFDERGSETALSLPAPVLDSTPTKRKALFSIVGCPLTAVR